MKCLLFVKYKNIIKCIVSEEKFCRHMMGQIKHVGEI